MTELNATPVSKPEFVKVPYRISEIERYLNKLRLREEIK